MKMLAETTGEFMLLDLSVGQAIPAARPAVIEATDFINARVAINQIVKVADVPDEATDEEFAGYWKDCDDRDLAISSFLAKFNPDAAEETPAPKGRRAAK